jgi:hypothetical protein
MRELLRRTFGRKTAETHDGRANAKDGDAQSGGVADQGSEADAGQRY